MKDQFTPHRLVAPNGLRIILKENHATPIVALGVYCLGGARDETAADNGITHLMQRLLLKGTAHRTAEQIAEDLEFVGTSVGPFTTKDFCGVSMSVLSRHFDEGLSILADCLLHPTFPEAETVREQRNILTEIARKQDDALSWCIDLCEEVMFDGHPYRLPLWGQQASVATLTREQVQAWHRRLWQPDRMVMALVGDVQVDRYAEQIVRLFGEHPNHGAAPVRPAEIPTVTPPGRRLEIRDKRQVALAVGYLAPPLGSPDMYAFDVLNYVLSGMGSRLFVELRDRQGLGYVVNCQYESRLDVGAFRAWLATSPDKRQQAEQALVAELCRLQEKRVGRTELARSKKYMLGLREITLQRNSAQAARYAYYEITGMGYAALNQYPRRIREVTAADVQRVAARWLSREQYARAEVVPG
ncbi:MAG: M16 family metallopeptidase [Candidatus Xenobia bacterium]